MFLLLYLFWTSEEGLNLCICVIIFLEKLKIHIMKDRWCYGDPWWPKPAVTDLHVSYASELLI